jgi:predicted oxidoreductase (fatty acid repression mutant protein)
MSLKQEIETRKAKEEKEMNTEKLNESQVDIIRKVLEENNSNLNSQMNKFVYDMKETNAREMDGLKSTLHKVKNDIFKEDYI